MYCLIFFFNLRCWESGKQQTGTMYYWQKNADFCSQQQWLNRKMILLDSSCQTLQGLLKEWNIYTNDERGIDPGEMTIAVGCMYIDQISRNNIFLDTEMSYSKLMSSIPDYNVLHEIILVYELITSRNPFQSTKTWKRSHFHSAFSANSPNHSTTNYWMITLAKHPSS